MATRLGAILYFRRDFPTLTTCVIVAEHRGSYTAVVKGSEAQQKFAADENNTCREVVVRKYLREQLENAGFFSAEKERVS